MPLFGKRDEVENRRKQVIRYKDASKKEFDLNLAIQETKALISLKPEDPWFHSLLADAYMEAPEVAVTRGVNVGFLLTDSAHLALSEIEKTFHLCERDPSLCPEADCWSLYYGGMDVIIYAHLCLREKEKAKERMRSMLNLSSFHGSHEPEMVELRAGDIETVIDGLDTYVAVFGELIPGYGYSPGPFAFGENEFSYLEFIEANDLPSLVKKIAEEVKLLGKVNPQPDEAKRHIEQVVTYRNLSKYKDAKKELQEARRFAPSLSWWYETLCEFGK